MQVSVSSVELGSSSNKKGFRINVSVERSRPGLLVSVLEAFEELGLDADVSCAAAFRLQALGSGQGQQGEISVDEQMVRQAVLQAIAKCIRDTCRMRSIQIQETEEPEIDLPLGLGAQASLAIEVWEVVKILYSTIYVSIPSSIYHAWFHNETLASACMLLPDRKGLFHYTSVSFFSH
jgi:hypothetical protein